MSKKQAVPAIVFKAQVRQFKTLISGEVNVTLALSGKDIKKVFELLEYRSQGASFEVSAVPVFISPEESKKDAQETKVGKGRKTVKRQRYPYRD